MTTRSWRFGLYIPDPDKWSLIGGNVEEGESYDEGLEREIIEEIGIKPRVFKYLFSFLGYLGEEVHIYHIPLTNKEVSLIRLGNEGQEVKFFDFKELKSLTLTTNLMSIYEKYKDLIEKMLE